MKIYTSYYGRMKYLPKNIIPVCISLSMPKEIILPRIKQLMPSWYILNEYKHTGNKEVYTKRFNKEILGKTSVQEIMRYIRWIANKYRANSDCSICLMCYEKSDDFCHRHIVSKWLRENGIECEEFRF